MKYLIAATCALMASAAYAGEKPIYAPAPDWVRVVEIPDGSKLKADTLLLLDRQDRLTASGDEYYVHTAYLARSPEGLGEAGNISLDWDPAIDDLILHKVAIHRGKTVIDLLARGQKLTVLRRETDLEQAMLDGRLTGALLAEGLEVGDVMEVAYTIRRKDPVLAGYSASIIQNATSRAKRSLIRQVWNSADGFRWRVSRDLPAPRIQTAGSTTELSLDMTDPTPREVPADAPPRFQEVGVVEASNFSSWKDISRLLAPHYQKAATLAQDGELKREARRILAENSTPESRARAALALVQERLRYVYIGMDAGGYVPAPADRSWSRRFGDCKGKTAVLLGLLKELGISARPALVSSANGDGLDKRLPTLHSFDHVIVRAEISGRTYWLDGTAADAGGLDRVEHGDFHWALPISPDGGDLEQIPPLIPAFPTMFIEVETDARKGTTLPVPMKLVLRYGGRVAAAVHKTLTAMEPSKQEELLKNRTGDQSKDMTVKQVSSQFDAKNGTLSITLTGTMDMPWEKTEKSRRYLLTGTEPLQLNEFTRPDGPDKELPVAVPPFWIGTRMTVLLPDGGKGFTTSGEDFEKRLVGMLISRKARVEGDRLIFEAETRSLQRELAAAEAKAAIGPLRDLGRSRVYLVAPEYTISDAERAGIAADQPKTAGALLDRGHQFIDRGEYALAVADMDAALKIDPKNARAMANRGIAKFWMDDIDGAKADFDASAKLDPKEWVWMHGRGMIAMRAARYREALEHFSAAIEVYPSDTFALYRRAEALQQLKQVDRAVTDVDRLLNLGEDPIRLHAWRAGILIDNGRPAEALKSLDKFVELHPTDPAVRLLRASGLANAKREAEAIEEYGRVIALKPTVGSYLRRARLLEKKDPAAALADTSAALALDPDNADAARYRAERLIAGNEAAKALAELDQMVARKPDQLALRLARAQARVKAGDAALALEDVRAARSLAKTNSDLNSVCWWGATNDQALEIALAACDAALADNPKLGSVIDSRGLVLFRLGRFPEALQAYDRALQIMPGSAASLYGRSLVKARLNDLGGSEADRQAALASAKEVVEEFEGYGIKPAKALWGGSGRSN